MTYRHSYLVFLSSSRRRDSIPLVHDGHFSSHKPCYTHTQHWVSRTNASPVKFERKWRGKKKYSGSTLKRKWPWRAVSFVSHIISLLSGTEAFPDKLTSFIENVLSQDLWEKCEHGCFWTVPTYSLWLINRRSKEEHLSPNSNSRTNCAL